MLKEKELRGRRGGSRHHCVCGRNVYMITGSGRSSKARRNGPDLSLGGQGNFGRGFYRAATGWKPASGQQTSLLSLCLCFDRLLFAWVPALSVACHVTPWVPRYVQCHAVLDFTWCQPPVDSVLPEVQVLSGFLTCPPQAESAQQHPCHLSVDHTALRSGDEAALLITPKVLIPSRPQIPQ